MLVSAALCSRLWNSSEGPAMQRLRLLPFHYMLGCVGLLGCQGEPTSYILCAPLPPWAVAVDVRDSVTNALLIGGSSGVVRRADTTDILYPDRLYSSPDSVLVGGYRVGLVEVRVERPGYAAWSMGGVQT